MLNTVSLTTVQGKSVEVWIDTISYVSENTPNTCWVGLNSNFHLEINESKDDVMKQIQKASKSYNRMEYC